MIKCTGVLFSNFAVKHSKSKQIRINIQMKRNSAKHNHSPHQVTHFQKLQPFLNARLKYSCWHCCGHDQQWDDSFWRSCTDQLEVTLGPFVSSFNWAHIFPTNSKSRPRQTHLRLPDLWESIRPQQVLSVSWLILKRPKPPNKPHK